MSFCPAAGCCAKKFIEEGAATGNNYCFSDVTLILLPLLPLNGLVVKRPITSPCHGEDRRFESGRARQLILI